jgi:putative transposase
VPPETSPGTAKSFPATNGGAGISGSFLKEVKLRITFYMNKRLGRTGTLWEGRYKSVLVEDCEQALLTISAYIDLNPIRAGIVAKPEDYRWCGYAEALAGGRLAKGTRRSGADA